MRNTYTRFLGCLMLNRVMDSKTITLYFGSNVMASRYRKRALNNGHICKRSVTERRDEKRAETTLYTITKSGVQYLLEYDKDITQHLLPNDIFDDILLNSQYETQSSTRMRQARRACAVVMAAKAGAAILVQNYLSTDAECADLEDSSDDDNKHKTISLMEYISNTLTKEAYQGLGLYKHTAVGESPMSFFTTPSIKAYARNQSSELSNAQDYIGGRYSGILESKMKTVLIFVPPSFGMGWYTWITQREVSAYQLWTKLRKVTPIETQKRNGTCAALIVENPREFHNLYRNTNRFRQSDSEEFGGAFDHLYILPMDGNGAKHLRWLMTTDDKVINARIVADAERSGEYKRYHGAYESFFPLMNASNDRVALGFQFDGKHLLKVEAYANQHQNEQIEFLCADWQVPYYERVLPENVHLTGMKMG